MEVDHNELNCSEDSISADLMASSFTLFRYSQPKGTRFSFRYTFEGERWGAARSQQTSIIQFTQSNSLNSTDFDNAQICAKQSH